MIYIYDAGLTVRRVRGLVHGRSLVMKKWVVYWVGKLRGQHSRVSPSCCGNPCSSRSGGEGRKGTEHSMFICRTFGRFDQVVADEQVKMLNKVLVKSALTR